MLLVSDELETFYSTLEPVEKLLGRRINPVLYTSEEFRRRYEDQAGFVMRVLDAPHVVLMGVSMAHEYLHSRD